MRSGRRNTPALSVTATKVLPESVLVAVTVTPGRTPPVESVIVPVTVASWAWDTPGKARKIAVASTQRICRFMTGLPPWIASFAAAWRAGLVRPAGKDSAPTGGTEGNSDP